MWVAFFHNYTRTFLYIYIYIYRLLNYWVGCQPHRYLSYTFLHPFGEVLYFKSCMLVQAG